MPRSPLRAKTTPRCCRPISLQPLLPNGWPGFELCYRFKATTYAIVVRAATSAQGAALSIDGVKSPGRNLVLVDDGIRHNVTLSVWRTSPPQS